MIAVVEFETLCFEFICPCTFIFLETFQECLDLLFLWNIHRYESLHQLGEGTLVVFQALVELVFFVQQIGLQNGFSACYLIWLFVTTDVQGIWTAGLDSCVHATVYKIPLHDNTLKRVYNN